MWILLLISILLVYVVISSLIYNVKFYSLWIGGILDNEHFQFSWLWPVAVPLLLTGTALYYVFRLPWMLPGWVIARLRRPKLPKATLIGLLLTGCVSEAQRRCEQAGGTWVSYNCHTVMNTTWLPDNNGGMYPSYYRTTECDHRCDFR